MHTTSLHIASASADFFGEMKRDVHDPWLAFRTEAEPAFLEYLAESDVLRTGIPTQAGQRSDDCGQLLIAA
jgi:hypothetical protein